MSIKVKNKLRLYVQSELITGQSVVLDEEQSHYLCNVMRQEKGTLLSCFDGKNGEFDCLLNVVHKKHSEIIVGAQSKVFNQAPDLWLLFAPVKKDKTDFIIEKATELGVRRIVPTITERTIVEKVRSERYNAQAIEAAEQCRRLDVPAIAVAIGLSDLLSGWNPERTLFFMDETGRGLPAIPAFNNTGTPAAILVGPEGGFSENELELLDKLPYTKSVSLGSRILRAETAVVAALAIWQASIGDWH